MKIVVTGATGFVGSNVVNKLKEHGDITVVARNISKAQVLFKNSVKTHKGDLLNYQSLLNAFGGQDVVVHIAGLIKSFNINRFYGVNAIGTRNVAKAARNAGVKRVIYLSSLAARGPLETMSPVSNYGASKLKGELEILRYINDYDIKILRPPIIYGPNETDLFLMFKSAKFGRLPVMRNKYFSFIYVKDLADAIDSLVFSKIDKPSVYHISDGNAYSWQTVADAIFNAMNVRGHTIKISYPIVNFVAFFSYFMKDRALFTLDKLGEIAADKWTCGYDKLNQDTGFLPENDINLGFQKTVEWYRSNGWL